MAGTAEQLTPDTFTDAPAQASPGSALNPDTFTDAARPSAALPDPETVDQLTTYHARQIAEIATRPPSYMPPPAIPAAPLPAGLTDDGLVTTGGANEPHLPQFLVDGARGITHGIEEFAQPGIRSKAGGASQIIRGGFEAATPLGATALVRAPIKAAASIGAGMISQAGVEKGLKKLGMPAEYAAFAGDLAGIIAGAGTHELTGRAAAAVKAKYEPILKARAEKANKSEASANSTGSEAYKPRPDLNPDTFTQETQNANRKKPATPEPAAPEPARAAAAQPEPAVGARPGGEPVRPAEVEPGAQPGAGTAQVTAGGPDIKLNEFHANRESPYASPARVVVTSSKKLTSEDIRTNFFKGHDISVEERQPSIFTSQGNPNTQIFNVQFHAPDGAHIPAPDGIEETLGIKPNERYVDKPVTGIPKAQLAPEPAEPAQPDAVRTSGILPESPAAPAPAEPAAVPAAAAEPAFNVPAPEQNIEPEGQRDTGPTYMGTGFGALEPLFREAKAEGDRLRTVRNEALAAAKAAEAKPEEMKAGEKIRAYFTSERDLWAARTNQTIDKITRLVLPKIKDREALGIAREFRHKPEQLQEFIDGTHPFLQEVDGGPAVWEKNLSKLMPVMRQAQRILAKPTARERAADAAFTNIAERDLQEARAGGWLESRFLSDEYLPHALNPAGEGEVAKLPSTKGRAMGKVGKYFGFGERRSDRHPTMVHAVADGIIPKTLDSSALFILHADQFARARATHLLEAHLVDSGLGKWGDGKGTSAGWEQLAAHTDEFKKRFAYSVPGSFDPESRESELRSGTIGLYVPPFISKALGAITDPDYTARIPGFAKARTIQRGLKEAILGMSGFHLLTENFMAAADIGPTGMLKAFRAPRESPETLANERDLIASGGTTSIQGSAMDAYRGLRPGTIPTRAEVVRGYILGSKQVLALADSITRFTFDNVQRRFKVWSFALHRDAWIHDNPFATADQLAEAKKGIASYVNGVYGGLHWENIGIARGSVEIARAVLLAPDWSGSNIALAKYAFDSPVSAREGLGRRLAGAGTKESTQARLARAFWTKQLLSALISTQMLSLLLSGQFSRHPFEVYLGKDDDGKDIFQNVSARGSIGDAVNLFGKVSDHAREGFRTDGIMGLFAGVLTGAGVFVQGKAAPLSKLVMHVLTTRDDFGRRITPGGLVADVLPIPIVLRNLWRMNFSDEAEHFQWSERIFSLFGQPGRHVGESEDEQRDRRRR